MQNRNIALGALAMTFVGASTAVSHTLVDAPLLTAQAIRYAIASLALVLLARLRRVPIPRPHGIEWLWLLGVALSGQVVFNLALVGGTAHAEPAVLAVAIAGAPVAVAVLGPLVEGVRPRAVAVLAAGVVTAGSALVIGFGRTDLTGALLALLVLACEVGFTVLALPVMGRLGPWGVSMHSVWIAAVLFAIPAAPLEGIGAVTRLGASAWRAIAFLAVLVTAIAFVCWYSAVQSLGSARAVLLSGAAPVSAALVGTALLGTAPGAAVWVGIGVVAAGLVLGLRPRSRIAVQQA